MVDFGLKAELAQEFEAGVVFDLKIAGEIVYIEGT